MRAALIAAAVLAAGCAEAAVCEETTGTYEWTATELAGNCGPMDPWAGPADFFLPAGTWIDGACTVQQDGTAAECSVQRVSTCEAIDGSVSVYDWDVDVAGDGRAFSAALEVRLYDSGGALGCASTYDVTADWVAP